MPSFTVTLPPNDQCSFIPWASYTTVSRYIVSKINSSLPAIYTVQTHMDSILIFNPRHSVTTTTTMRITVILLALAVGAAALPTPGDKPTKEPLVGGPSHFSFSFSPRLPSFAQLVDRWWQCTKWHRLNVKSSRLWRNSLRK